MVCVDALTIRVLEVEDAACEAVGHLFWKGREAEIIFRVIT